MALNAEEKFDKLTDQIQYQDPALKGGRVDQVVVHQKSRCWDLHLYFPQVLPFKVYHELVHRLQMSFQELAHADVKIVISTDTDTPDSKLIVSWNR